MKLGNLIEKITTVLGIKYLIEKFIDDCKCHDRQDKLNVLEFHSKWPFIEIIKSDEQWCEEED